MGFELAGRLGFAVAMAYTAFQCLKTGLLSRFWGSLGAALGAVSFLFAEFSLLWFIYAALLIAGWVPGGRPPAWATGEAMPWPKPGEEDDEDEDDYDFDAGPGGPADDSHAGPYGRDAGEGGEDEDRHTVGGPAAGPAREPIDVGDTGPTDGDRAAQRPSGADSGDEPPPSQRKRKRRH